MKASHDLKSITEIEKDYKIIYIKQEVKDLMLKK